MYLARSDTFKYMYIGYLMAKLSITCSTPYPNGFAWIWDTYTNSVHFSPISLATFLFQSLIWHSRCMYLLSDTGVYCDLHVFRIHKQISLASFPFSLVSFPISIYEVGKNMCLDVFALKYSLKLLFSDTICNYFKIIRIINKYDRNICKIWIGIHNPKSWVRSKLVR